MTQPPPPPTYVTIDPREQVNMPAILLIVVGAFSILLQLFSILMNLLGTGIGATAAGQAPEFVTQLMSGALGMVFGIIGLVISAFIIYGAMQMRQLRQWVVAVIASVAAMLPCTVSCCCILGLPVGIWSLVVLMKPGVKQAFR